MTLRFVGYWQQTGLKGSEGMSEDVRALSVFSSTGRAGFGTFLKCIRSVNWYFARIFHFAH